MISKPVLYGKIRAVVADCLFLLFIRVARHENNFAFSAEIGHYKEKARNEVST